MSAGTKGASATGATMHMYTSIYTYTIYLFIPSEAPTAQCTKGASATGATRHIHIYIYIHMYIYIYTYIYIYYLFIFTVN